MAQRTGQGPDRFRHLREGLGGKPTVPFFECEICGLAYPETTIKVQSGRRVCPDDWEEEGGEIERDLASQRLVTRGADREARKRIPKYPYSWEKSIGIVSFHADRPYTLAAGSPSSTLVTVNGVNINSTNVTTLSVTGGAAISSGPTYASDEKSMSFYVTGNAMSPGESGDLIINSKRYRDFFLAQ